MTEDVLPNPPLPLSLEGVRACGRFIKGVAATKEDAASRKAVFSTTPHGKPSDLDIPQYAMHEYAMHEKTVYVVTQAEEAQGFRIIGALRVSDGSDMVGFENEFEFLGADLPYPRFLRLVSDAMHP
jgi:hypothetical protein